jgi:hypothetical protein
VQYHHRSFLQEGSMVAMPLAFPGITTPIPADECATVSLAIDSTGMIFGGTAGRQAHLFAGMTRGATGIVHDLGPIPGATACTSVMTMADRTILLATSGPEGGGIYRHPAVVWPYDCFQEWGFARPGYEEMGRPVDGEGIACAVLDANRDTVYGVSDRTGTFFGFDLKRSKTELHGKVDPIHRFSKQIVRDLDARIYGTLCNGSIWRFDPATDELVDLDITIPCAAGREIHNQAEAFALDPVTGVIYGSGSSDGFLFAFDPTTDTLRSLGKPGVPPTIRCLAVGNDGRLFGICGGDDDIGHLFCYDPTDGQLRDLGVPISLLGVRAYGYVFASAVTGPDGEIVFGQAERMSNLWLYFPAIAARPRPDSRGEE